MDFTSNIIRQLGQPSIQSNQISDIGAVLGKGISNYGQQRQKAQAEQQAVQGKEADRIEALYTSKILKTQDPVERAAIMQKGYSDGIFDDEDMELFSSTSPEQLDSTLVDVLKADGYENLLPDQYRRSGKTKGRIIEGVDENGELTYFQDTPQGIKAIEGFAPPRQAAADIKYQEWLKRQRESGDIDAVNIEKTTQAKSSQAAQVQEAKSKAVRSQGFIDSGIEAADALSNLKRTRMLLDDIKTGGIDNAIIKGKQYFGVESADEGELSARLGKSVLAQLKPIFGSAFTAQEGQRLEGIEARLGANAETNKRLIEDAYKLTERAARRGLAAAKKSGDDFTYNEIKSALDELDKLTFDVKKKADNDTIKALEAKFGIK